jgi:hypothetical protein
MPVELHERLSEFSYGYGVTREVERRLRQQGLSATPFLPSLLHEASLGFDVAFHRPGTPLLLQFKLGQAMRRFVPGPRPTLQQPFWRYHIDTAEPDGQFELLLKAEQDGADVFYLAPKFHDWEIYLEAFEHRRVLRTSLIVSPGEIRRTLDAHGVPDGDHKIVYDEHRAYLCSEPLELASIGASDIAAKLRIRMDSREATIAEVLEDVFEGFENRSAIRRRRTAESRDDSDRLIYAIPSDEGHQPRLRRERLERILDSGRSHEEAIALAVGAEAWSSGAQLIFVTEPPSE